MENNQVQQSTTTATVTETIATDENNISNSNNNIAKKNKYKHDMRAFYHLFLQKLPFLREYKPLAIGVKSQIQQALWSDPQTAVIFSKTILRRMMAMHTTRGEYLRAVINSKQRYNLDGTPADINSLGAIKEKEIEYSQNLLKNVEERIEKAQKKRELEKIEKEKEQKRKQTEYFQRLKEKKLAEEAKKIIQKNKDDDAKFASIVKTKSKPKLKIDTSLKSATTLEQLKTNATDQVIAKPDSNISSENIVSKAAESAEKPVKKTLTLKGKLKLKPKKDDDNK